MQTTVLIPAYNAEGFLEECLNSVVDDIDDTESPSTVEILVVLDHCTDRSKEIAGKFAHLSYMHLLENSSTPGLGSALNFGISHARGDLIFRFDADDIWLRGRLQKQHTFLEKNPQCVAVGSQYFRLIRGRPTNKTNLPTGHRQILHELRHGRQAICHSSLAVRREALQAIGPYWDEGVAEDWDLYLRLAQIGELANIDEPLINVRFHNTSINSRNTYAVKVGIELAIVNDMHRKEGRPDVTRAEVETLERYRALRIRARRRTLSLVFYRRALQGRDNLAIRSVFLFVASMLMPSAALKRLTASLLLKRRAARCRSLLCDARSKRSRSRLDSF